MILGLKFDVDHRRLSRIITNLRRAGSGELLERINLDKHAKPVLKHLVSKFPKSRRTDSSNREEFGLPLWSGWRLSILKGATPEITISHVLDTIPRAREVLTSIDQGHSAFSYVVSAFGVVFKGTKKSKFGWITLAFGRRVFRGARPGVHYIESTYDFIVDEMIPKLQDEIRQKTKKLIEDE